MRAWREFEAQRRVRTRDFYSRHRHLRILRLLLWPSTLGPLIAVIIVPDYGDRLGLPDGTPRLLIAMTAIGLMVLVILGITAALAWGLWREERRLSEAFGAVGLASLPIALLALAPCVVDLRPDSASCGAATFYAVLVSICWVTAWSIAGPLADFVRSRGSTPVSYKLPPET